MANSIAQLTALPVTGLQDFLRTLVLDGREADIARDARGAWDYAVDTLGARPDRIVIWGESLGGGVATGLAQT